MKFVKSFLCAVFASLCMFAFSEEETKAKINFWNTFSLSDYNTVTVTYADGTTQTFYGGSFNEEEMDINSALEDYYSTYNTLKDSMGNAGLKSSQVSYNMAKWSEMMTAAIYKGLAEQNRIDAERIAAAEGDTEEAAEAVAELQKSTAANMEDLRGSLDGQLTQVSAANSQLISSLASSVQTKTAELEDKIEQLQQNSGADESTVKQLQTDVQKLSQEVAANKKAIAELKTCLKEEEASRLDDYVLYTSYTNTIKRMTHYLGNTNANPNGIFMVPQDPVSGQSLGDSATIDDYLAVQGVMAYINCELAEKIKSTGSRYDEGFEEKLDKQGVTNVEASFSAPINWADGSTIVSTNGKYSIHKNYQFVTNIIWATNWTEAVSRITKEETQVIVNVVTNLVDNYQTVTTQVYKVEAFTNWYEMVDWTTNVTVNVISQKTDVVNLITNTLQHYDFVTNVFNYESFITNVFMHTNVFVETMTHENFVTNMFRKNVVIEDFVTNHIDHVNYWCTNEYHNVTNVIGVLTNEMVVVTNVITTTTKLNDMPDITWDTTSPSYEPTEDPYNPQSEYNPSNPNYNPEDKRNPFYDSLPVKLDREYDDITNTLDSVTNTLNSASNTLHSIAGGFEWMTNNFQDVTNSINALKEIKNNVKIYQAISNGTYVSMYLDHKSVSTNTSKLAEIKGFENADVATYPYKKLTIYGTNQTISLGWEPIPRLDSEYSPVDRDGLFDKGNRFRSIENATSSGTMGTTNVLSLYGFSGAEIRDIPFVNINGEGAESQHNLDWANLPTNQFEITDIATSTSHDINIKGFSSATEGQVPYKEGDKLAWTNVTAVASGGEIKFFGNDNPQSSAFGTNVVFDTDSNIKIHVSNDDLGRVKVKMEVFWK